MLMLMERKMGSQYVPSEELLIFALQFGWFFGWHVSRLCEKVLLFTHDSGLVSRLLRKRVRKRHAKQHPDNPRDKLSFFKLNNPRKMF